VLFVCCLIVVPLPPGENPFAVNNNNNNKNHCAQNYINDVFKQITDSTFLIPVLQLIEVSGSQPLRDRGHVNFFL
jgi:hypothetical protein